MKVDDEISRIRDNDAENKNHPSYHSRTRATQKL